MDLSRCLLLAGPTAVGKSAVALRLAHCLHGEIVSVDSMQVYRGLDLGTAKPSSADRARVQHHLLDVADPAESFDAARFLALAQGALSDILARGRQPILCGGTGLYFKALLEGLRDAPPADPALRRTLEATPLPALLAELEQRDPAAFARIDRHNVRRIVRALEVLRTSGTPAAPTWSRTPQSRPSAPPPLAFFFLTRTPADLRARIHARVVAMFAAGLVDETRALLARPGSLGPTAQQALGYHQVLEHLRGQRSLADTVTRVQQKTWQYARRQQTWFRHQLAADWIALEPEASADAIAARLVARLPASPSRAAAAAVAAPPTDTPPALAL